MFLGPVSKPPPKKCEYQDGSDDSRDQYSATARSRFVIRLGIKKSRRHSFSYWMLLASLTSYCRCSTVTKSLFHLLPSHYPFAVAGRRCVSTAIYKVTAV